MKQQHAIFLALFLLALILVPVLTGYGCLRSYSGWSVEENRALASAPELSAGAVWDGSFTEQLESFYKDHIFARRTLLKLDTALQMRLLRRPVVRGVVLGDTVLLPETGPAAKPDSEALTAQAGAVSAGLQSVQQAANDVGARLLYALVPEQRSIYASYYPSWMENPADALAANRAALLSALNEAGIDTLDMTPVFSALPSALPYYSRVDHHYTLRGAYLTYQNVCSHWGLVASDLTVVDADSQLLGTYSRKLYGLSPVQEAMQILQNAPPSYERLDNGQASNTPLIAVSASGSSLYTDYMGGDIGETIIRTNRLDLPKLLIVGDSFTNALEPLAVFDFDEMRSLDYRHFDGPALSDYIRAYRPDYVLILRDDVSCLAATGNGALQ